MVVEIGRRKGSLKFFERYLVWVAKWWSKRRQSVRRPRRRNASPKRVTETRSRISYNVHQIHVMAIHMAKTATSIHQIYVVVDALQSIHLKARWIALRCFQPCSGVIRTGLKSDQRQGIRGGLASPSQQQVPSPPSSAPFNLAGASNSPTACLAFFASSSGPLSLNIMVYIYN